MPLSDAQWVRIEPLLPDRTPKRGGRWRNHREVIDAIAFKFQTGTRWVHLPEKYGNWRGAQPVANVGRRRHLGTRLHRANWVVSVDSTIVRAHQHAAGAVKGAPAGEPDDHPIGRSRGGLTTKLRPSADGNCRPLAFVLTAGQPGDAPAFTGGMPSTEDAHKQRNTVERCIDRLKQWRGIATRYEKTATIYLAGLHVAGIFIWSAR